MPGRTPHEAFQAFIDPLRTATSCLGPAKITPSSAGTTAPNVVHAWALNGGSGLVVGTGWHFEAQMHYMIVPADEGGWKISTRAYRYRLARVGHDAFRIHWHPDGVSPYKSPHVHLSLAVPDGDPLTSLKEHMPTGRLTYEDAIEWAIETGVPSARGDWRETLAESRDVHLQHRTWSDVPPPKPEQA